MTHEGLSVWELTGFHRDPDVVVIGGGLVGLFTALFHRRTRPHHHVMVLERGAFPSGASVKNAGFACFGSPSELMADIDAEGLERAVERVTERWHGLNELRAELGDAEIGFETTGGYEVYRTHDPLYTRVVEGFDRLNEVLRPIFGRPVYRWDKDAATAFGMKGLMPAVHTDLEGPLDSGRMMRALLRKCQAEGVVFRPNCAVSRFEEGPDGVIIHIEGGDTLKAVRVVVATNGYTRQLLPEVDVVPARGQVLLTAPVPGLRLKGTFHLDEGFYYFRDHQGAVLLGGGRNLDVAGESTDVEGTSVAIQQALEQLLREVILPDQPFTIAQR